MIFEDESEGKLLQQAHIIYASDVGAVAATAQPPAFYANRREFEEGIRDYENAHKSFNPGKVAKYVEKNVPSALIPRSEGCEFIAAEAVDTVLTDTDMEEGGKGPDGLLPGMKEDDLTQQTAEIPHISLLDG